MKVYLAGLISGGSYDKFVLDPAFRWRKLWKKHHRKCHMLESYHYIKNKESMFQAFEKTGEKLFLDSGAFSLFTQGIEVNLKAYAEFIKRNQQYLDVASNLDAIGRGKEQESYDNQKTLESYGVEIIPVHHARDDDKWLIKYLKEGYNHIALGGMVIESTQYLEPWLDRIWDQFLTKKSGKPKVKVHGFGLTTQSLMVKYPWYSVDSTTWMLNAAYGGIWTPTEKAIYKVLMVSDRSPARKSANAHYLTLSDIERKAVDKLIKKHKFKKKHLAEIRDARALYNLQVMVDAEKNYPWPKKFKNTQKGLFD